MKHLHDDIYGFIKKCHAAFTLDFGFGMELILLILQNWTCTVDTLFQGVLRMLR